MTAVLGDVGSYGFGSTTGGFASPQGSRLWRLVQATGDRVDIRNLDFSFTFTAAANTQRIAGVTAIVFRCSAGVKDPTNLTFPNLPGGFEQLWLTRLMATGNNTQAGGTTSLSGTSFPYEFGPGVLSADKTKQLFVVVTQPLAFDGGPDIYIVGSTQVNLNVLGTDYGLSASGAADSIHARSFPRSGGFIQR